MFRKTLKTIKYLAIIAIVLLCLPHSLLPRKTRPDKEKAAKEYENRNTLVLKPQHKNDSIKVLK